MGGRIPPGPNDVRERELLGRLGLDERATAEDIARTRDELQSFLATAPRSIRGWARTQASGADEAFALLSDPTAWREPGALPASHPRSVVQPGGPATPPIRRATPAAEPAPTITSPSEDDDDATFEALLAEVTPSMHRDRFAPRTASPGSGTPSSQATTTQHRSAATPRRFPKILTVAAGLVAVVAVAMGVYRLGIQPVASGPGASPSANAGLDEARVAALMGRVQQDPKDTAALLELGDTFFQAGDYSAAVTWLDKLVALEPNNVRALLALGAAKFNLDDVAAARANWEAVLKLDADNVEAHYDLGYLYLNQTPPDITGMQREWNEVIRLAPGTEIAAFVQQHFDALATPSAGPAASPGTSATPSAIPSGGPAASPGTSAAPSGSVAP